MLAWRPTQNIYYFPGCQSKFWIPSLQQAWKGNEVDNPVFVEDNCQGGFNRAGSSRAMLCRGIFAGAIVRCWVCLSCQRNTSVGSLRLGLAYRISVYTSTTQSVRDDSTTQDVSSYNAAISAWGMDEQWEKALNLMRSMEAAEMQPDSFTHSAMIHSCGHLHWEQALMFFERLGSTEDPTIYSYSSAIAACGKAMQWQISMSLLDALCAQRLQPNRQCVVSVAAACKGGQWERALDFFDTVRSRGLEPNAATYSALLEVMLSD